MKPTVCLMVAAIILHGCATQPCQLSAAELAAEPNSDTIVFKEFERKNRDIEFQAKEGFR